MRIRHSIPLIALTLFLAACQPEELQEFDFYVLNPDELKDASEFCLNEDDAKTNKAYCDVIKLMNTRYANIESEFNTQQTLYFQYSGFYPEIDKKAKKALAEAKKYVHMKKKGLKNSG